MNSNPISTKLNLLIPPVSVVYKLGIINSVTSLNIPFPLPLGLKNYFSRRKRVINPYSAFNRSSAM
jgi:hypothetical protein